MVNLSDYKCFQAEYAQHFSGLLYFAQRYVGRETACDLIQDFFARLWEKQMTFADKNRFIVYIYRSVRNRCLTWLRDQKRQMAHLAEMETELTEESFLEQIIEAETYSLINDAFETLPEASKRVYIKSLEGKSHKEIAQELHIAINTIKRHKNNANHLLRERLKSLFMLIAMLG